MVHQGQTPPTAELGVDLVVTSARLTRFMRRQHPHDSSATWRALSILADQGPLRLGEFAQADLLTQPAATAKMNRLVAAGLAAKRPDPFDKRAGLYELTAAGREHLDELRASALGSLAPALDDLTDRDRELLRDALALVNSALARSVAASPIRSPLQKKDDEESTQR